MITTEHDILISNADKNLKLIKKNNICLITGARCRRHNDKFCDRILVKDNNFGL